MKSLNLDPFITWATPAEHDLATRLCQADRAVAVVAAAFQDRFRTSFMERNDVGRPKPADTAGVRDALRAMSALRDAPEEVDPAIFDHAEVWFPPANGPAWRRDTPVVVTAHIYFDRGAELAGAVDLARRLGISFRASPWSWHYALRTLLFEFWNPAYLARAKATAP